MVYQSGRWKRKLPAAVAACFGGACFCGLAAPAAAQPSAAAQDAVLPEVVVSAQRISSLASKTPVAMTVLSGAQLEAAGIDNPAGLGQRLPSVSLDGNFDGLRITIRGVSNADTTEKGDPSAAFMLDGIYLARPQSQNLAFFDLARVEVLRGPQGTLYGRNTTAGVVNLISNTPGKEFEGEFGVELGNYRSRKGTAMLNVPVSESLALRAAVAVNRHDSYLINRQGTGFTLGLDRDDVAARLSARLALGQTGSLLLRYDHTRQGQNNDSIVPVGNFYTGNAPVWTERSTDERLSNGFKPANAPLEQGGAKASSEGLGAELEVPLGALRLYYLGAHRRFDNDSRANFYYRLAPTFAIGVREAFSGQYRQDSHELRLATASTGPLTAQAGVFWFREQAEVRYTFRDLQPLGLPPYYIFPHASEAVAKAVFGQATWSLSPQWRLTAGARYSDDDKQRAGATNFQQALAFNPATDMRMLNYARVDTHKTTWRLGAEADLAPATLLYATVSTGYKAGGFNDGCLAGSSSGGLACPAGIAVPAAALLYQPETLTSWESGLKTRFWDGRASLHANAFYYDYANLQLSGVAIVQGAPRFITTNAGQAKVRGLEFEGQFAVSSTGRLSYTLALLDAHYAAYLPDGKTSWAGRKLDRAPSNSLTLGYEHSFQTAAGQFKAGLFSRRSSSSVISVPSQLLQYRVPGRSQSDLNLSYRPDQGHWSLFAHLRNLENKVRPIAIDSFGMLVPSAPRTWSAGMDYRF